MFNHAENVELILKDEKTGGRISIMLDYTFRVTEAFRLIESKVLNLIDLNDFKRKFNNKIKSIN